MCYCLSHMVTMAFLPFPHGNLRISGDPSYYFPCFLNPAVIPFITSYDSIRFDLDPLRIPSRLSSTQAETSFSISVSPPSAATTNPRAQWEGKDWPIQWGTRHKKSLKCFAWAYRISFKQETGLGTLLSNCYVKFYFQKSSILCF